VLRCNPRILVPTEVLLLLQLSIDLFAEITPQNAMRRPPFWIWPPLETELQGYGLADQGCNPVEGDGGSIRFSVSKSG